MAKRYVQVNIGADDEWSGLPRVSTNFTASVMAAIRASCRGSDRPPIEIHNGHGLYNGVREGSTHVSIVADVDIYALRKHLADLKAQYKQDTIALIVGSDTI